MFNWNVAQDMLVSGNELKGLIAGGGGWRELIAKVDLYTGNYFNFVIYIDAPNEARPDDSAEMVAAIKTRQGIWVKFAQRMTSGQYANLMIAERCDPVQQAVGHHLKKNPGDNYYGYGAYPALAWKAFERMRPSFVDFLMTEVAPYLSRISGGLFEKIYLVGKAGTAGATGPGTLFGAINTAVECLHRAFPHVGISVSERYLDGFGFEDCGPLIKKNASLSAKRIHYHGTHFDLLDVEDRRIMLCTLPRDGKDREKRDRHVAQLGAMLYSAGVAHELRATAINEVMGADYGQFQIVIPVYYPMIPETNRLAAAANKLLLRMTGLMDGTDLSLRAPSPITDLNIVARTARRPAQAAGMLLKGVQKGAAADDETLLANLAGHGDRYNYGAEVRIEAVFANGADNAEAQLMLSSPISQTEQLIQRLTDVNHLINMVTAKMSGLEAEAQDARFDADGARTDLQPLLQFTYGNFWHQMWNGIKARSLILHKHDDRVKTVADRADSVRQLEEKAVLAEEGVRRLQQLHDQLIAMRDSLLTQFEQLTTILKQIASSGIPFEDIELAPINELLLKLMYAATLPDAQEEVRDILRGACLWVGPTTFARTLGYTSPEPIDLQHLAALIKRAMPESVGMPWGGKQTYEGPETQLVCVPLDPNLLPLVADHLRKLSRGEDVQLKQLTNLGAGVFMGGLRIVQVIDGSDIETETVVNIVDEMTRRPGNQPGIQYLRGLIPGVPVTSDQREEIGLALGIIQANAADNTDNQ